MRCLGWLHTVLVRGGLWLGVWVAVGMTVGVSFGFLCGGYCPPFVAGLSVCHCGFGLWWLMAGECLGLGACGGSFGVSCGVFLMGVLLCREKSCEGGFLGLCGDVRGVGVLGRVGLGVFVQGGVVFWLVWSRCACAGLAPRAPLLLVGGRRRARGGMVRAEDAGLCALEIRGLSPLTPVEAVQGCPLVAVDVRRHMGFFCSRR